MKQREIPIFGEVKKPELVPEDLIDRCENQLQAIQLCIQYSHHSYESVRDYLNMNSGNFSRMMNGTVNLPLNKIDSLMMFCGNLASLQFMARKRGYDIQEKAKDARIAALEEELQRLKTA